MTESSACSTQVHRLLQQGVNIPEPSTVHVGEEVDPDRIAPGVSIQPGSRLSGSKTSLGPGCRLGDEAPVTVENCQAGKGVKLKGTEFVTKVRGAD